jgi:hypothetical protein
MEKEKYLDGLVESEKSRDYNMLHNNYQQLLAALQKEQLMRA